MKGKYNMLLCLIHHDFVNLYWWVQTETSAWNILYRKWFNSWNQLVYESLFQNWSKWVVSIFLLSAKQKFDLRWLVICVQMIPHYNLNNCKLLSVAVVASIHIFFIFSSKIDSLREIEKKWYMIIFLFMIPGN